MRMYDRAFIDYLLHFHCERDYFECHEVLEEHWKAEPPKKRKKYWVGLIQIAVGLYHQRRGNFTGALRMISNSIQLLENDRQAIDKLGLHSEELIKELKNRKNEILDKRSYYSFNIPIIDQELLHICQMQCKDSHKVWGKDSDLSDEYLIHKHIKRNRSAVIEERFQQLELRRRSRNSR
jgi:predicted metal-dependent hydrolase